MNKNLKIKSTIKENLIKQQQTIENSNIKQEAEEEPMRLNEIKPLSMPIRPDKNKFEVIPKNEINNPKDLRLKAYNIMKKKVISKDEINELANLNVENEPLNKTLYDGNVFIQGKPVCHNKKENTSNKDSDIDIINKFEHYYNDKFKPIDEGSNFVNKSKITTDNNKVENIKINENFKNDLFEVNLNYTLGINTYYNKEDNFLGIQSIAFHKTEKWIAYLNKNLIIIENFQNENNRDQHILNDSKYILDVIKISENGKILMAYSTNKNSTINNQKALPQIFYYSYNPIHNKRFTLINKITIKHSLLNDCEISPQNNMCLVVSNNNNKNETFVSVLDFIHNEILVTTVMTVDYFTIKWNQYITNLEFTTLSFDLYTFWRVNSSDVSLQYQHGDYDQGLVEGKKVFFTCMEYTPPLSLGCVILLLVAKSDGEIWGIDTKTNSVNIKYTTALGSVFIDKNIIRNVICSLKYITIISDNFIKIFKLPFLKEIKHDNLNLFINKEEVGDWGLGIGDWGLGMGIGPNPQSPIPNPPIPNPHAT